MAGLRPGTVTSNFYAPRNILGCCLRQGQFGLHEHECVASPTLCCLDLKEVGGREGGTMASQGEKLDKSGNWITRHKVLSAILGVILLIIIISVAAGSGNKNQANTAASASTTQVSTATSASARPPTTVEPTTTPTRKVTGQLVTLGAGMFKGGVDVKPGLYDVTPGAGQSGNFVVQGDDTYDEILGDTSIGGVPKVRARISDGDTIQISSLSHVTFTPVTSPLVTTHTLVTLYAGTWTVGQDIGPGRYVATPGAGQSGNFIVEQEFVDEILGNSSDGGVPSVTVNLSKGDVITISGMSQVTMTPA